MKDGLVTGDLFIANDEFKTTSGTRGSHAQQRFLGLRVFRSFQVVKKRRGETKKSPVLFRIPSRLSVRPELDARVALRAAFTWLQEQGALAPKVRFSTRHETQFRDLSSFPTVIDLRYGLKEPVRLHLEVFPVPDDEAELGWVMDLRLRNGWRFHTVVSAHGKRPKVLFNARTNTCAFDADWLPLSTLQERRTFPIAPFTRPDGQPGAATTWQDTAGRATGPNVSCHLDDASQADALGALSIDNSFVWSNYLHDFFEGFGFDAAHSAFEGTDPLRLERRGETNAKAGEFDNHRDGFRPVMALYSSPSGAGRHAARDPGILIHEYTHGVSSRLVGGSQCAHPFVEKQAWAFSEGMSDFFALTVLNYIARQRQAAESLVFGRIFKPGGIRNYTGYNGSFDPNDPDPYSMGKSWCASLLDSRAPISVLAGNDFNKADRFLWQVCINTFKSMVPICQESLKLTFAHAKGALIAEMEVLEESWGVSGAGRKARTKFSNRGIQ